VSKAEQYGKLVVSRKICRACIGVRNPADAELAEFDSDQIGPWSRLHGDLNADLMIVGQDWAGVSYYQKHRGLDDLQNPTMVTLERLLRTIGRDISMTSYDTGPRGAFLTNAILCLKEGGLQAPVKRDWFANCGTRFLRHQVEIVAPRVVVTMGRHAYEALLLAYGERPKPFREAVESPSDHALPNGSLHFPVYHCGQRVLNTHRSYALQVQDWAKIGQALQHQRV